MRPVRTTLPDDLSTATHLCAAAAGLSTAEFVRGAVLAAVLEMSDHDPVLARMLAYRADGVFASPARERVPA